MSALAGGFHLLTAFAHPGTTTRVSMAVMAGVCLPCAVHLWRGRAGVPTWSITVVMGGAMVLVHLLLAAAGHAHHATVAQLSWLTGSGVMIGLPTLFFLALSGAAYRSYQTVRLSS
ncbi:hypothetical protein QOZ88_07745 [Blastococcus sp. BMG 814]|uniref:Uncharacterized protein n=1 Tax=Blastococcus carthaginiensis TaxID=3050034 RepID=A0ABT9IBM3_9ACTN|nr:hypothetical protein [Blastococcus carthaginiensis]MDP5182530.1 hypothetical protein [Blastococcus carthaginiensis]